LFFPLTIAAGDSLALPIRFAPTSFGSEFWLETVLTLVTGILFVITPVWPDWIEVVPGWDPDRHNGSLEWTIAGGLLIVTVAMFAVAANEWRRAPVAEPS
jgi:hypothetical protein